MVDPSLKATAQEQYDNRFDLKCECGAELFRKIEWAYQKNQELMRDGKDPYIIKRCRDCAEKANAKYKRDSNRL